MQGDRLMWRVGLAGALILAYLVGAAFGLWG